MFKEDPARVGPHNMLGDLSLTFNPVKAWTWSVLLGANTVPELSVFECLNRHARSVTVSHSCWQGRGLQIYFETPPESLESFRPNNPKASYPDAGVAWQQQIGVSTIQMSHPLLYSYR